MRLRPPYHPLFLLLVFVCGLGLLALGQRSRLDPLRIVADRVLTPLERGVDYARAFAEIKKENDELRVLATHLAIENFYLKEYRFENKRLHRLLSFREENRFKLIPVRVVARTGGRGAEMWRIDKGAREGIEAGMAIVSHRGLVGRIVDVLEGSASIRTLRNQDVRVSAMDQRSRVVGILAWQFPRGFRLLDVPAHADMQAGDQIVSSGLGGVFPPGIPLGRVKSAGEKRGRVFRDVVVEPHVDFSLLEEVYVVREGEGEMGPMPAEGGEDERSPVSLPAGEGGG
jgi:rod shape-determining protein MreC